MIRCRKCGVDKPKAHFHAKRTTCKDCFNEATRNAKYMSRYGITATEADEMKKSGCNICGDTHNLHIDHNHDTGEVRGVLCKGCNQGIGLLGDSPDRLRAAAQYLDDKGTYERLEHPTVAVAARRLG